jgi:hypothetical protein
MGVTERSNPMVAKNTGIAESARIAAEQHVHDGYGSFDITVETTIGTVNYGPKGSKSTTEEAFAIIGRYSDSMVEAKPLTFSFPFLDRKMSVLVWVDEAS